MNNLDYFVTNGPTGVEYEIEMISGLKCEKASEIDDLYCGTDGYLDGIRVDFTHAFDTKDHLVARKYIEYLDLWLGIRTGNERKEFSTPVCVIGGNYEPSYVTQWILPNLNDWAKKHREEIADEVSDFYWGYMDSIAS